MSLQDSATELCPNEDGEAMTAAQGGLYAATIRHHRGTFYVVCTNVLRKPTRTPEGDGFTNFIVSTTDIWADEWSEPVIFDFVGIDTSLFWDDDDRVWVTGSGAAEDGSIVVYQLEIDVKTGATLTETKPLWEGISKVYPEGPHIYKKDGWYYLLIAEGGCFADHHTIMARSRKVTGPYESNPANPVLPIARSNRYVQNTGHGDLFQDPSGQWYFVCLGVRNNNGRFIMGRESYLTTATWSEGEFPVIDPIQIEVPLAIKRDATAKLPITRKANRPHVGFVRIRDPIEENYEYDGNSVTLVSSKADLSQATEPVSFTGKRHRHLDGSSSVTLEPLSQEATSGVALKTGLCYYKDEHRFIRLYPDWNAKEIVLEVVNKARSIGRRTSQCVGALNKGAKLTLGFNYTELDFVFWYSIDAGTKERFEKMDTLDMTGLDFVGPVIGVFAVSDKPCKVQYSDLLLEDL